MKDYYQILGLSDTATAEDIKKAYRKLAMTHHPDRETGNETKFKEINEAHDTLSDISKKSKYDMQRKHGTSSGSYQIHGANFGDLRDEMMDALFRRFTEEKVSRHKPKNKDILLTIQIELKELLEPKTKVLSYKTSKHTEKQIEVHYPKSLSNPPRTKYPGLGDDAINNIPTGDLLVEFRISMPNGFWLEQSNVLCSKIDISVWDALTGSIVQFKNYDDSTYDVMIPVGTQFGTGLSLKGKGVKVSDKHRGDLKLLVQITIPKDLNEKQLAMIKEINSPQFKDE